ncbi:unnamed protein product [Phytomonas sp. Hart1]|nr:unnamed protein product [Phytomonas sp. Hart1]|eukprot:CCW71965.1 unnamed protein product [Phytomonas sp. isolate Hart1]
MSRQPLSEDSPINVIIPASDRFPIQEPNTKDSVPISEQDTNQKCLDDENWQCTRKWPFYEHRVWLREYFAEFFGMWVFMTLGQGTSATTTFLVSKFPNQQAASSEVLVMFGWGLAVAMGLFVCMGVSGGHMNPSVTFANCLFGAMPWRKFPGYVLSQTLGSFTAAFCIYILFYDRFQDAKNALQPGETMTLKYGGIFCTYPSESNFRCLLNEFLDTTILLFCIMGMFDPHMTPANTYKPLGVGLLIITIAVSIGINSGFCMNPARDLGPRIASSLIFGSTDPFTVYNHYFWIPTFVPPFGAAFGMFLYTFFIISDK